MKIILHSISSYMEKPVILALLILALITALLLGMLISEYLTEHRHLTLVLPQLLDKLKEAKEQDKDLGGVIAQAGLFPRQRDRLLELIRHPDYTDFMRESLAVRLLKEEQEVYDRRLLVTDLIAKIAPMLGLLGTLIPLGPGIIALGRGDVTTLSASLLTAFDTTVVGLICAGLATVISAIRKVWYRNYISIFETLMECILDLEKKEPEEESSSVKKEEAGRKSISEAGRG